MEKIWLGCSLEDILSLVYFVHFSLGLLVPACGFSFSVAYAKDSFWCARWHFWNYYVMFVDIDLNMFGLFNFSYY